MKTFWVKIIICVCVVAGVFIFFNNNYGMYGTTIVKIESIETSYMGEKTGENGKSESFYEQNIAGKIMNGDEAGERVEFTNTYSKSGLKSNRYNKNDRLFVSLKSAEDGYRVTVLYEKRDQYFCALLAVFILAIMFTTGKRGTLTIVSLFINTAVFAVCMKFFKNSDFFGYIWIICSSFFCIFTLVLAGGINKKTLVAIIGCIVTVLAVYGLYRGFVYESSDIPYDYMSEYIITPLPLRKIFMVSVITGLLGAVMDVSITVSSSVYEIVATAQEITIKALIKSIQEIGHDIMGTMINVLFFSYLSSAMPLIILKMHSGYSMLSIFRYSFVFDIVRFLIGAIGIVMAIPVTGLAAILFCRRKLVKTL